MDEFALGIWSLVMTHMRLARALVALVLAAAPLVMLSGCHTVQGVGEDIEAAGQGISGAAEDTNPYK